MRLFVGIAAALICAGCASYTTPGGPAPLAELAGTDAADLATRQPSPDFPASIGVVRVQAAGYRSASVRGFGKGRYSLVTTQELLDAPRLDAMARWTAVSAVKPIDPALLPEQLESLDDLRLAAAKLQLDVLLIVTVDTSLSTDGQKSAAGAALKLGKPASDAAIDVQARAQFMDVRTGYVYGGAEASARAADPAAWAAVPSLDRLRLDTERQAVATLLGQAEQVWSGIEGRYH